MELEDMGSVTTETPSNCNTDDLLSVCDIESENHAGHQSNVDRPISTSTKGRRKRQIDQVLDGNLAIIGKLNELVQVQRELLELKKLKYTNYGLVEVAFPTPDQTE